MSMLSDISIRKSLNKDIVIEPFDEDSLTPVGYDLRIGDFVFSPEHGLLHSDHGRYLVPPKSMIWIMTKEFIWVSNRIGGTVHSMVSRVTLGLLNAPTTLDPGWNAGPLLIPIFNASNGNVELSEGMRFATLVFYRTLKPALKGLRKSDFLKDILTSSLSSLMKQLNEEVNSQMDQIIARVRPLFGDTEALNDFKKLIKSATEPNIAKVVRSLRNQKLNQLGSGLIKAGSYIAIILIAGLHFYWNDISWVFHGISYDSKIFAAQVAAITGLLLLMLRK